MTIPFPFLDIDLESKIEAVFIPVAAPKGWFGLETTVYYYVPITNNCVIFTNTARIPVQTRLDPHHIVKNITRIGGKWAYNTDNFAIDINPTKDGIVMLIKTNGKCQRVQRKWKNLLFSKVSPEIILGLDDHRVCAKIRKNQSHPRTLFNIGNIHTRMIGTWLVRNRATGQEYTPANAYRNRHILGFLDSGCTNSRCFECVDMPIIELVTNDGIRTGEIIEHLPSDINDITRLSARLMLGL